ncbi:hypothetical protein L1887_34233 [Cichorium endivia]|nr:hypothetical protein L1887_34233 [Cichorium endivia]
MFSLSIRFNDRSFLIFSTKSASCKSPRPFVPVASTLSVTVPENGQVTRSIVGLKAVVEKKRSFIYVYDLPPDFKSILLEGHHFKLECVNRIYDQDNASIWTKQLYGSQVACTLY